MALVDADPDPARWDDLMTWDVDGRAVELVRPADTAGPCWAVYESGGYLGTVAAELHGGEPLWRVQATHESFDSVADAVRALRRPASWPRERQEVTRWARELLNDDTLTVLDLETTGLNDAWVAQIAAVDRDGSALISEYVNPRAEIEPAAIAVHGITPDRVTRAPVFSDFVEELAAVLHDRTVVAYNADFDRGVPKRELTRHFGTTHAADE